MRDAVERAEPPLPRAHFVAISFEPLASLAAMRGDLHADFYTLCSDTARAAYAAFGLGRATTRDLWRPATLRLYLGAWLRGKGWGGRRGADVHQLGGDVVVDAGGCCVFVHRSREPADRPPASRLVELLRSLGEADAPGSS